MVTKLSEAYNIHVDADKGVGLARTAPRTSHALRVKTGGVCRGLAITTLVLKGQSFG